MLNLKKGLALVLAAATALTFAPVSTLGLTGVVQAQAAEDLSTGHDYYQIPITAAAKGSNDAEWDSSKPGYGRGDIDLSTAAGTDVFFVKISGLVDATSTAKSTFTVEGGGDVIKQVDPDDTSKAPTNKLEIAAESGSANTGYIALKAVKTGTATVTITSDHATTSKDDDTTLTLNFTVKNNVSTKPTFESDGKQIDSLDIMETASTGVTVDVKFGSPEVDGNHVYYGLETAGVVTADKNLDTLTNGKSTIKLTPSSVGNTNLIVYPTSTDVGAGTNALATLPISVKAVKLGISTENIASGETKKFTYTSPDTNTVTYLITNSKGQDVTDDFVVFSDTTPGTKNAVSNGTRHNDTPVKGENYLWIRPDSAPEGDYDITLTQTGRTPVTGHFKVTPSTSGGSSSTEPAITDQAESDVFGGVTTYLYATDETSYDLVNSDANFQYQGVWYTADQLKWYLTKTPNSTSRNMGFTQGSASITESGTGKLNIRVANAEQFKQDVSSANTTDGNGAYIIGVYTAGHNNTIVYKDKIKVEAATAGETTKTYSADTIPATQDALNAVTQISDSFVNNIRFIGVNNRFLDGAHSAIVGSPKLVTGTNFDAKFIDASGTDNAAKGSTLTRKNSITRDGVYYETYYVEYKDTTVGDSSKFIAQIHLTVSVNAGPTVEVKEGNFTYSLTDDQLSQADDKVIDLDLTTNKTFDIAAHSYSNKDNTTYAYDRDTENVTVDAKGVVTAAKVGTAKVTITPSADGVKGTPVYLFFRVNQNANDQISVTGKDGDKATVLNTRQYHANNDSLTNSERNLAAAQVGYVQVEVTGEETADVKEAITVKGTGKLSYALAGTTKHGESIDAKTGQITIPHSWLNTHKDNPSYVFPVKVVSTETNTSALTTGYFYVVVDFADAQISGLEDSYEVGTSLTATKRPSWLNLGLNENEGVKHVSANTTNSTSIYTVKSLGTDDDLDDSKLYDNDDSSVFVQYNNSIERAIAAGKTEHVLVTASDYAHKIGATYRVVTLKSVAGQNNYVTKIENVETGKTIYQQGAGVNSGASITINKPTVVKVTVAHTPDASLVAKDDPAFTINGGTDDFNYDPMHLFVAATENPNTYEITLIPSVEGTQIIDILPTQGRLSATDYSLVRRDDLKLAVKYSTADSKNPAQVKGVKLGNKKGAKVVVKFTKDTTDKNIKYYVQKKVGKKTSGKSVGSNRTILSVKKGATVKVRVKAYYYDANGTKHVGKYSKWVTKKTDKK